MVDDLVGVISDDLEGEGVTNIFRETNKATTGFGCLGWKRGLIFTTMHRLKPLELQESTNVRSGANECLKWCLVVILGRRCVIKKVCHTLQ